MCDVGVITALALSAGSVAANQQAQKASRNAMNKVNALELGRQKQLQQEQGDVVGDLITKHSLANQQAQEGSAAAVRDAAYSAAVNNAPQAAPAPMLPTGTAVPQVVQDEFGRNNARANTYALNQGRARSIMDALADSQYANSVAQARAGQRVNQLANFSRGSLGTSQYELMHAQHAGDGLKTVGDVLQGLSMTAGMGAAMGKFPTWSSMFGTKAPVLLDAGAPASNMWSTTTMIA